MPITPIPKTKEELTALLSQCGGFSYNEWINFLESIKFKEGDEDEETLTDEEVIALIQEYIELLDFATRDELNALELAAQGLLVDSTSLATAPQLDNTLYNIKDQYTGEVFTADKVTLNQYGVAMNDTFVDNVVYFKKGSFYYKRNFSRFIPEYWGAKGDGTTDDTVAVQKTIDYVKSLGKGAIQFLAKTYSVSHLYFKHGVNMIGSAAQAAATVTTEETGTAFKARSAGHCMFEIEYDGKMTAQFGFQSAIYKSSPSVLISGINFMGGNLVTFAVEMMESWGFTFHRCRFSGGQQQSLAITDCNNFQVVENVVKTFLFLSNADYNVTNNEIIGTPDMTGFLSVESNFGMASGNKIYYGATPKSKFNYNIIGVDTTGLFTTNAETTFAHQWELSGVANGTFAYNSETNFLQATVNNGLMYILVDPAFLVRLTPGVMYNLTVEALLTNASVAGSRGVTFTCGNVGQTYGSATLVKGVSNSVNISFIYNPPNPETSIVKIIIPAVAGISGVDYFEFSNLQIKQASNEVGNKLPMIFEIPESAPQDFRNIYGLADAYYIKWVSITTFRIAETYKKYEQGEWLVPLVNMTGLTNISIHIPFANMAIVGLNSSYNDYVCNKIEDIESIGVQIRGASGNVFAGNSVMKGNVSSDPIGFSIEGGAMDNMIGTGYVGNRSVVTNMDKLWIGIRIDKYSNRNRIGTLSLTDCKYLDIQDNYVGTSDLQNLYEQETFNNCFAYKVRATDYSVKAIGHRVVSGTYSSITSSSAVVSNTDFSLVFKDVVFDDNVGISVLFQQTDASGTQPGRLKIIRNTSKGLVITVGAVTVYTSAYLLENDVPYDITVLRDSANVWVVYINGVVSTNLTSVQTLVVIATGGTTKSYIGGDTASAESFTIRAFKYCDDTLSDAEVKTLFSNSYLDKNNKDVTALIDTSANYAGAIGTIDGLTIPNHSSVGYTDSLALKISLSVAPHFLTLNPADKRVKALRMSFYVKSSNVKGLMLYRGLIGRFLPVGTGYEKKTIYLRPDMRYGLKSEENITLVFGKEEQFTFGSSFSIFSAGDVYVDKIKIWNGLIPVVVDLDFSVSNNLIYYNKASLSLFNQWVFPSTKYVENSTTTELSKTTLDNTYPNAPINFEVICKSITTGQIIYKKFSNGWAVIPFYEAT